MGDIVERLRDYKPFLLGEGEWFGPAICTEAADLIESLRAENARLTEERDALRAAVEAWFETDFFAEYDEDGMPARYSEERAVALAASEGDDIQMAVQATFRALAKVKGGPDAR